MASINDLLGSYNFHGQNLSEVPGTLNFGTGFTATKTPQMVAKFMQWAGGPGGPLERATRGAWQSQAEAATQAELAGRRQLGYSMAAQGISPTQATGILNERTPAFQSQMAQGRAGAESQFQQGILGLGQSGFNAIREAVDRQRMMKMQQWMFEQQQQAIHKGQDMGLMGSLIGAGATLAGAGILAAGSPMGGALGAMSAGGGGDGGVPSSGYPSLMDTSSMGGAFGPPGGAMLNWSNPQVPFTDGGAGFFAQNNSMIPYGPLDPSKFQ